MHPESHDQCPWKRRTQRCRGDSPVKTAAGGERLQARATHHCRPYREPGGGVGRSASQNFWKEPSLVILNPDFEPLTPRTEIIRFCCFKPCILWSFVLATPGHSHAALGVKVFISSMKPHLPEPPNKPPAQPRSGQGSSFAWSTPRAPLQSLV